jgi:hypothetical protein
MKLSFISRGLPALIIALSLASTVWAADNCTFVKTSKVWTLTGSCETDTGFVIPKGVTVNGFDPVSLDIYKITAIDPPGGHFVGPVLRNTPGQAAYVKFLIIRTNVADYCGDADFAGILLEDGAGTISSVDITVNRNGGLSSCPEGIAVLARKLPSNPKAAFRNVVIKNSNLNYNQLAAFVGVGNVNARLSSNMIKNSDGTPGIAPRGIEIRENAKGTFDFNQILRHKLTPSDPKNPAYGILLVQAGKSSMFNNVLNRNDIAVRVSGSVSVTIKNNTIQDAVFDGILVDDENGVTKSATVWGNEVRKCQNGIHLKSVGDLVQKNLIKENSTRLNREAGIICEGGYKNKIQSNTSDTNDIIDIADIGGSNLYTRNVCAASSGPPVDCP